VDAGQLIALSLALLLIIPAQWLKRKPPSLLVARYVCMFTGIALLLALAVGSPTGVRFWIVLAVASAVLLPYLAALTWFVRRAHK
jgi:hypothetical protein